MMSQTIHEFFAPMSHFAASHLHQIAGAMVATLLGVYGGNINRYIKQTLGKRHFFVRTAAFIAMCAFGYGLLAVIVAGGIAQLLAQCDAMVVLIVVIIAFIVLGILAERKKCI